MVIFKMYRLYRKMTINGHFFYIIYTFLFGYLRLFFYIIYTFLFVYVLLFFM